MSLEWTFWMGMVFLGIAVVNPLLAGWLWTFPMAPDPGGPDPNGKSTAPRFWTGVHRVLGFVFVGIYLVMLWEMVPRLLRYQDGPSSTAVLHAALGAAVGPVLFCKVMVIRRWQRFGKGLPILGGLVAALAIGAVALVATPSAEALAVSGIPPSKRPELVAAGRRAFAENCVQCHGASAVMAERRSLLEWLDIFEEMQEEARKTPGARPISSDHHAPIGFYLFALRGEVDEETESDAD